MNPITEIESKLERLKGAIADERKKLADEREELIEALRRAEFELQQARKDLLYVSQQATNRNLDRVTVAHEARNCARNLDVHCEATEAILKKVGVL